MLFGDACNVQCTNLLGFSFVELDTFVPLVDVVWVLTQEHAVEEQWSSVHQVLESRKSQFKVKVV